MSGTHTDSQILAVGERIALRIFEDETVKRAEAAGLHLPDRAKEKIDEAARIGIVLSMGMDTRYHAQIEDGKEPEVNVGDHVLISKYAGVSAPWDSEIRMVHCDDIQAVLSSE